MKPGPKPKTLAQRFEGKYAVRDDGCWIWQRSQWKSGYGKLDVVQLPSGERLSTVGAHVASYLIHRGPLPPGTEIDHLCRVKLCVNPGHLEPVSHQENITRSWAARGKKTECYRGHPYDDTNTRLDRYGRRFCKACERIRRRPKVDTLAAVGR